MEGQSRKLEAAGHVPRQPSHVRLNCLELQHACGGGSGAVDGGANIPPLERLTSHLPCPRILQPFQATKGCAKQDWQWPCDSAVLLCSSGQRVPLCEFALLLYSPGPPMPVKRKADEALTGLFGEYASDDDATPDEGMSGSHSVLTLC